MALWLDWGPDPVLGQDRVKLRLTCVGFADDLNVYSVGQHAKEPGDRSKRSPGSHAGSSDATKRSRRSIPRCP